MRSLAAVAGCEPTPFHGADGADALQGIGRQWPIRFGGGLESLRSLAAAVRRYPHYLTAPTERTPSRESASNVPSVGGNDVRWRPGGLRSLAAVAGRKSAPFHGADGADALQGIG